MPTVHAERISYNLTARMARGMLKTSTLRRAPRLRPLRPAVRQRNVEQFVAAYGSLRHAPGVTARGRPDRAAERELRLPTAKAGGF